MKKTGKCIGGPLDGRTVTAEANEVEAPAPNEAYDPLRNGVDVSDGVPSHRDGAGNERHILVRYRWKDEAWRIEEA